MPCGDVHRVGGAADEAVTLPRQCSEAVALGLGHVVESRHTHGQTDIGRPVKKKL